MKTVPFNPKNKTHLKGFEKWVKKMAKHYRKNPAPTLVMTGEEFRGLKFIVNVKNAKNLP